MTITILGAGLSGCIAAALTPRAQVFEALGREHTEHRAVLRFREPKIGRALGIPFKEVTVHKSVYDSDGHSHRATPAQMNEYSLKVLGHISPRSIGDLAPAQRWIAPDNLHTLLVEMLGERVRFNARITQIDPSGLDQGTDRWTDVRPLISTMLLPTLLDIVSPPLPNLPTREAFSFHPILVHRYRLPDCDAHQTVYFPSPRTALYRATLTGDTLIAESIKPEVHVARFGVKDTGDTRWAWLADAFGLRHCKPDTYDPPPHKQRYGKILPLPPEVRKRTLYTLTSQLGIFSLGRFACWRNILLDDMYEDLYKIRRMIDMGHYDLMRTAL